MRLFPKEDRAIFSTRIIRNTVGGVGVLLGYKFAMLEAAVWVQVAYFLASGLMIYGANISQGMEDAAVASKK